MIVITGAAGFIASCLVSKLNKEGHKNLVLVDDFSKDNKKNNYSHLSYERLLPRHELHPWLREHAAEVSMVFHLGARTDTTEFNKTIFDELNVHYSMEVWKNCASYGIPLVYASSAATYGLGEHGYNDDESGLSLLKPLNPYGDSKNEFDKWALAQEKKPPFWAGLKFFNVYGPNEYHKGRMASVIFHAFKQIQTNGRMKLFRSHHPDYKDGEQLRDFVYVKDVVEVCHFFLQYREHSGIYNLGTGQARSFLDLARSTFKAMGVPERIEFIDTPADIRDKYQYFTEANMQKLKHAGYRQAFSSLEDGIEDYVKQYLLQGHYY